MPNPFIKMKAANKAAARVLNRDRKADYKVTQQGLNTILANLQTSQKGLGKALSKDNQRILTKMGNISAANTQSLNKLVRGSEGTLRSRYGAAIGTDPNLLRGTKAVANSQKDVNAKLLMGGNMNVRAGNQALDIIKAAGVTAGEAAQYELAQALSERAGADAEAIAERQTELAKIRLDYKLQMQAQEADAALNERYLRLQSRLANGGAGGEGFQSAASSLLGLSQNGASRSEAEGVIGALAVQYNLGPAAKSRLSEMVNQLWGGGAGQPADDNSTPYGEAFREQTGMSPTAFLDAPTEQSLNAATWRSFDPSKPVPDTAQALTILGVHYGDDGKAYNSKDEELSEEYVAAGIAYVQSTWYRALQAQGATTVARPAVVPNPTGYTGPR